MATIKKIGSSAKQRLSTAVKKQRQQKADKPQAFRNVLTKEEQKAVDNLARAKELNPHINKKDIRVCYYRQDNFTIATIYSNNVLLQGVTKRNTSDATNPITGQMYAFTRALKSERIIPVETLITASALFGK